MKLYYAPGACSLASHITLQEAGLAHEIDRVDFSKKQTASGENYDEVNPKGYVPAIRLDDGAVMTEGPAILQYLADRVPESALAPAAGSIERVRLQEWLNFITSELHKSFGPLFSSDESLAGAKDFYRKKLTDRFAHVEKTLADGRNFLTGDSFTIADAYLFTVSNWGKLVGFSLDAFPKLNEYIARVSARPAVRAALQAEGLLDAA
jgi:glutathione S-transferase